MKQFAAFLIAACIGLTSAPVASAATLGVYTHDYGNRNGRIDPPGDDRVRGNHVEVQENRPNSFSDSISFADLAGATIDSLELTLTYDRAGPAGFPFEEWLVDVQGSNQNSFADDFTDTLVDTASPLTLTLTAATDTGSVDAFATSLANMSVGFTFDEIGFVGLDTFRLFSARLTVNGTAAVVPLPAPGLLLLAALGGLGLMRRRRRLADAVA
ncbi:VPLPA-CTERM sorting domain-containing protein [Jannaschia sp. S6380]|uniref:VPLPA-CTERM sorting domain-containing protein n=1 Tax=Jannaschia sp. S6380 TaxID=2926408 RepID=UPI001FF3B13E|nr:VPLPA-CTERM sorting domain-containing protein [Jannaschia sp. S6380]MCK0168586.1 VPLPA-CTERM sorting domain-containing protein [Jannaschia sp. S6380]